MNSGLKKGIDQFNSGFFFEAHDTLEELWNNERDPIDKKFYHGLIHIAVGFYHLTNYNFRGAVSQFRKAVIKLDGFPETFKGVAIGNFMSKLNEWLKMAEDALNGKEVNFDFEKIPKIKFVDENANRQI